MKKVNRKITIYEPLDKPLDDEEREIMEAGAAGLLKPIPRKEFEVLKKQIVQAAKNSIAARKKANEKTGR